MKIDVIGVKEIDVYLRDESARVKSAIVPAMKRAIESGASLMSKRIAADNAFDVELYAYAKELAS